MEKIPKIVLAVVITVIVLLALITGVNIFFIVTIFDSIQSVLCSVFVMDSNLAKALTSFAIAGLVMVPLGKMILSYTPIPQKNKVLYRSLLWMMIGIFFLLIYVGTKDTYFDSLTGQPMKYYSIGIDEKIKLYSEPGFSRETGDKLLPVTKEIIRRLKGENPEISSENTNSQSSPRPDPNVEQLRANQQYLEQRVVDMESQARQAAIIEENRNAAREAEKAKEKTEPKVEPQQERKTIPSQNNEGTVSHNPNGVSGTSSSATLTTSGG